MINNPNIIYATEKNHRHESTYRDGCWSDTFKHYRSSKYIKFSAIDKDIEALKNHNKSKYGLYDKAINDVLKLLNDKG